MQIYKYNGRQYQNQLEIDSNHIETDSDYHMLQLQYLINNEYLILMHQ